MWIWKKTYKELLEQSTKYLTEHIQKEKIKQDFEDLTVQYKILEEQCKDAKRQLDIQLDSMMVVKDNFNNDIRSITYERDDFKERLRNLKTEHGILRDELTNCDNEIKQLTKDNELLKDDVHLLSQAVAYEYKEGTFVIYEKHKQFPAVFKDGDRLDVEGIKSISIDSIIGEETTVNIEYN